MQLSNSKFDSNRTSAESNNRGPPNAETKHSAMTTTKTTIMSSSSHPGAPIVHVLAPGALIVMDTQAIKRRRTQAKPRQTTWTLTVLALNLHDLEIGTSFLTPEKKKT